MTAPTSQLSMRRLERALRTAARLVDAPGGECYVPFFEKVEAELEARRRTDDVRARARALLRGEAPAAPSPTRG